MLQISRKRLHTNIVDGEIVPTRPVFKKSKLAINREWVKPDCLINHTSLRITMLQLFDLASITLCNMTIDLKELIADYACNLSSEPIIHIVRTVKYVDPMLVIYEGSMGEMKLRKDINDLYSLYS